MLKNDAKIDNTEIVVSVKPASQPSSFSNLRLMAAALVT